MPITVFAKIVPVPEYPVANAADAQRMPKPATVSAVNQLNRLEQNLAEPA
ncbi:hypothetical protein [Bradyrhizobium cenepequi]|nr:hypothetical protein [Bradyrhizobium cenepequi]